MLESVKFCPFGNLEKAREIISEATAAIIVEPIQGESGIHIPPEDFLAGLRTLADKVGATLIFDEVQSGFGRTGKMWACENWQVRPDILTASKGIAGGVPFGFTAVTESISSSLKPGEHTSTFGGNALSCAAALAALNFLQEERLLQKAEENGNYFIQKLKDIILVRHPKLVREVRGKGLMIAVELKVPVKEVIEQGFDHGLVLLYAGLNILRFLPPLVITKEQIDTVVFSLDDILSTVEKSSQQTLKKPSVTGPAIEAEA